MIYNITIANSAKKVLKKWKKSNPALFRKASCILEEIMEHPRTGTGHPEPLKGGKDITYSRRITGFNRIIYDVYDDKVEVEVIDVEGHYDDK